MTDNSLGACERFEDLLFSVISNGDAFSLAEVSVSLSWQEFVSSNFSSLSIFSITLVVGSSGGSLISSLATFRDSAWFSRK